MVDKEQASYIGDLRNGAMSVSNLRIDLWAKLDRDVCEEFNNSSRTLMLDCAHWSHASTHRVEFLDPALFESSVYSCQEF